MLSVDARKLLAEAEWAYYSQVGDIAEYLLGRGIDGEAARIHHLGYVKEPMIGDDEMQRRSQGYVRPDAFTHGSSAQRVEWFKRGLSTGDMKACDTFSAERI